MFFLDCETQWRVAFGPTGKRIWLGVDYSAAIALLSLRRRRVARRLMPDLQVMELAALKAFGQAADRDA